MDNVTATCFLCCVQYDEVLKEFARYFRIQQVKATKKRLAEAVYKLQKRRNGDKKNS